MWEWRLNMETGTVSEQQIDDRGSEFPQIPDSLVGLKHRYGYCLSTGDGGITSEDEGGQQSNTTSLMAAPLKSTITLPVTFR